MPQLIQPLELIANSNLTIKIDQLPLPTNIKSLRVGTEENPVIDQKLFRLLYDESKEGSLVHLSPGNWTGTLTYEWDDKDKGEPRVNNKGYVIQPGLQILSIGDYMFALHSKRKS